MKLLHGVSLSGSGDFFTVYLWDYGMTLELKITLRCGRVPAFADLWLRSTGMMRLKFETCATI
jgi:hypothetical protein